MKLRGRKKAVAVCHVPPTRRLSRRMMPVAPTGREGSENTKPLAGTCNLPNIAKKKMTTPDVQLVDLTGMAPTWEKTNRQDWWQTSTSLTSHSSPPIQRKELQENVNLQMNGMTRSQPQFKDAEKPVVQLYVCFFCERDFQNKDMLQTHQKICTLRPAHLQDLCTPNKQSRPRVNIADPRKNMYVTTLGLLPAEKAKHMELAHRIRRDSQIDCDLIEVDQAPVITPRTPTTPRTPKSLISFNTPSISKQQEVCLVSSDDDSDAGSSDGSLLGRQDYICQAPLMTIDFSSPLGVRIKGHIKQVNKPNINDYEKFCRTPVKNRFKERLRERDSFAAVTFKHKRHFRKFYHTYRFSKDDSREFMELAKTGLNRQSRDRLKHMKPCRVVLKRLMMHQSVLDAKKSNVSLLPAPLSPEKTEMCSRSSSPDSLPDLSCTFPSTPVVKCYDLKSLLGATPSRLAVLDKNSEEVDEHTRNRVIVYKAILADAMQDSEGESGPSRPNGQFVAMRSLLRRGNPNPLPTSQQTRAKLAMEGTDDDWVFSSNSPGMESQPKEKPQEKKAEYVPKMLSSLSPEKSAPRNSTNQTSHQNVPRSQLGLASQQFPPYRSKAMLSQSRQIGLSNKPVVPPFQPSHNASSQSASNNHLVRRSGRTRHIEKKIDDEISIMVPVCDDTSPTLNTAPLPSRTKRPLMGSEMSGPSAKMPRLDHGRQNVNAVQPRQVVKRLSFDNPGMNHSKPCASVQPNRSTQNNVAMNPRINLGTRQAHNINLANHASPRNDFAKTSSHGLRRGSNAGISQGDINTDNLPKLGVHESGKVEDNNFLFKCHLCGLEEQYSVNATNKIYNHLHTVHKEEVIHIVDYNTQGEVHLVEAMGQPPTMIRTSNFSKPLDRVDSGQRSMPNPPAYYGISSEPTLGQGPPNTNCISSVPSVEGAWYNNMKNKSFTNNNNNISPRNVPQMRGKVSPQYSLRPKTPPKSYSQVTPPKSFGQPTPPTTPPSQSHQSVLSRRSLPRINYSGVKSSFSGTKFNHSGSKSNFSGAKSNFSGTKSNVSRSFIVDDDDVVCLDDDVICIS
ncbi:uncharacterized protein LOC135490578 isoform X2 [Lineus longissimus]|uniref:uncharacterized protein LOC135490578 isoform X2 n=1 Tax=Lineus longissimus TaxID=88925 RepID=UPI00315D0743